MISVRDHGHRHPARRAGEDLRALPPRRAPGWCTTSRAAASGSRSCATSSRPTAAGSTVESGRARGAPSPSLLPRRRAGSRLPRRRRRRRRTVDGLRGLSMPTSADRRRRRSDVRRPARRLRVRGLRGARWRATARPACGSATRRAARPDHPRRHAAQDDRPRRLQAAARRRATRCRSSCSPRAARRSTRCSACKLGADDYVTKPFGFMELMARVEAVLRRAARPRSAGRRLDDATASATSTLDFKRHEATKARASRSSSRRASSSSSPTSSSTAARW